DLSREDLSDLSATATRVLERKLLVPPASARARFRDLLAQEGTGLVSLLKASDSLPRLGISSAGAARESGAPGALDLQIRDGSFVAPARDGLTLLFDCGARPDDLKLGRELPPSWLSDTQYQAWVLLWSDFGGDPARVQQDAKRLGLGSTLRIAPDHTY